MAGPLLHPAAAKALSFFLYVLLLVYHANADTEVFTSINATCTGGNYTKNSNFSADINSLLSTLKLKSSSSLATSEISGSAYGLYFCTGDLSLDNCQACIETAMRDITKNCPSSKQAIIWYEYCELRYSDTNFLGVPDSNGFPMSNPFETTTSSRPVEVVSQLVKEAPTLQPLMFSYRAFTTERLYALAQCSPDLTREGCSDCLTTILANIKACCSAAKGWRYLSASCWIRYEYTPFLRNIGYIDETHSYCPGKVDILSPGLNITNILSDLTTNTPARAGFYNTSEGVEPNKLYGLALCRGDLAAKENSCWSCLKNASISIVEDCSNKTQGIEWYESCFIKYSDQDFFGVVDSTEGRSLCSTLPNNHASAIATEKMASRLIRDAVDSPMFLGVGKEVISGSETNYVLVQCTRDLSRAGCKDCLERGMNSVFQSCNMTKGWRYLSGSCTLRYEDGPFFDVSVIPTNSSNSTPSQQGAGKKSSSVSVVSIIIPILAVILLASATYLCWRRFRHKHVTERARFHEDNKLPFMDLASIQAATSNFADENKLGEGGFGPVYKGVLNNGTEIAVKRLSTKSNQGDTEFENEVKLIAKLQHRNLVRMLNWCVEREEKLLIYEYLQKKSLDAHLFDPEKRSQLDWNTRLQIIGGISRGLLYLHEDSLLKVIHRDLKASNVLLDNKMTPKISDFGLAKIFRGDETEAKTNRVVGTYGYMAPEYVLGGLFSAKSDVYSFGVLLLEILTGQRNGREHFEEHGQTLIRNMWHLWVEGRAVELMDPLIGGSYLINEAMKCIKIGLLCVQENAEERPTMSLVVHMLRSSDETLFPEPSQPPTFMRQRTIASDASSSGSKSSSIAVHSVNDVTNSDVQGR